MKSFKIHIGTTVALMDDNINTDQILPSRFLSRISKKGFGECLFANWRYVQNDQTQDEIEVPDFVLNQPDRRQASILITGDNFAGGSSREHAVWALDDWGIRCVIAGGFSDIFYNNSFKNGLLAITLPLADRQALASLSGDQLVTINLETQEVHAPCGHYHFDIDPEVRHKLLYGIDDIVETLNHAEDISAYESKWDDFYEPGAKALNYDDASLKSKLPNY
ncbi:3-isopropylmalate/(R)-2-methylmalate dehydratase small subunit [Aerococcus urinaehominis]|uniref:3-isopropylmalate dehydratase small subunit n=1 Tax=Aerococcus urinaehominis TaxID=128944 RepID=UPI0008914DFF|nr:3-isopropylmalate dehydratase small subunit [Aerococcus urinaehominis]SDM13124.1 3-isopropylmalate/(R)-2-methylmalate dehydratase small subunit [Aerococcus urinaehominis]